MTTYSKRTASALVALLPRPRPRKQSAITIAWPNGTTTVATSLLTRKGGR